jgi:xanthine dehydrogenase iron-sulfur cluster and FAD-binding subunit A
MWDKYYSVASIDEALDLLDEGQGKIKIIAGGTDLILEMKHGQHQGITSLVDISRVKELSGIKLESDGIIRIGAGVTHNQCLASQVIRDHAFPLMQACHGVGTPQIRNIATIAGNLATASPANDTIVPLIALGAEIVLASKSGKRIIKLEDFYKGVRSTILLPSEMITEIRFKALQENQTGVFKRYILRAAHSISVVNTAIILSMENKKIAKAAICIGCVAPTIVRANEAETYLAGKELDHTIIETCASLAIKSIKPINDIRASDKYRTRLVRVLIMDGLGEIKANTVRKDFPDHPVLLMSKKAGIGNYLPVILIHGSEAEITTKINGKNVSIDKSHNGLLVDLIRDRVGLTGTKLGCGEGECGACTITMDGLSVFSCLIPAPRAHNTTITTIEGIAKDGELHPVQQAYIDEGAVQCGYCTPGFIMSTIQLLDEIPLPTKNQIKEGLSGNLCRCTGYYRIITAVEKAAKTADR